MEAYFIVYAWFVGRRFKAYGPYTKANATTLAEYITNEDELCIEVKVLELECISHDDSLNLDTSSWPIQEILQSDKGISKLTAAEP